MLRLPPALRALVAARILQHSSPGSTSQPLTLYSAFAEGLPASGSGSCSVRTHATDTFAETLEAYIGRHGVGVRPPDSGSPNAPQTLPKGDPRLFRTLRHRLTGEAAHRAAQLGILDVNRVLETCTLPSQAEYPEAPKGLFDPDIVELKTECDQRAIAVDARIAYAERPINDPDLRLEGRKAYHTCTVKLSISGVCEAEAQGDGASKVGANRAAMLHLMSKLHLSGALARLLSQPKARRGQSMEALTGDQRQREGDPEPLKLSDSQRIRDTHPMPTEEQYPAAPKMFWGEHPIPAINVACTKLGVALEIEADYSETALRKDQLSRSGHARYFTCALNVNIEGMYQDTSRGEGLSKSAAKQAAWTHMVSNMHISGALARLFPAKTVEEEVVGSPLPEAAPKSLEQSNVEEEDSPDLIDVDTQTLEEEKDAKTEIYNYAAGYGVVPQFESSMVQPRTPRARLGRRPKTPRPLVQVNIRSDELSINVTATGTNFQTAEVAAALAFKQKAEERHSDSDAAQTQTDFRVLEASTAKMFLNFCKARAVQTELEMESDAIKIGPFACHRATLTANGSPIGQSVTMLKKDNAQAVAYLTGALEIAKQHPQLLAEFKQALAKGHGSLLQPVQTIEMSLEPEAAETMRSALVEAHAAGLPPAREVLTAEMEEHEGTGQRWRRRGLANPAIAHYHLERKRLQFEADPALQQLREKRDSLPMRQYEARVLDMVKHNGYSIVVGATGSGKTTQVPQILFEQAIREREGAYCNIVCTQPRRIAATSVAQRVAAERNEALRETVGHHVRFDAKPPYNPYGITYCTTGILLERLKHDPDGVFDMSSHILIDEVHERDLLVDYLMIMLKKAISIRLSEGKRVPKVVLMSATLDTRLFADYFRQPDAHGHVQPAPCLSVPGRTYPVHEKYLGSIMQELFAGHGSDAKKLIAADSMSEDFLKVETDFSASASGQRQPKRDSVIDWKRERKASTDSEEEGSAKAEKEEALVPVGLVASTIAHICATTSAEGAILVFLPGLEEILKTQNTLLASPIFGLNFADASKFMICALHSSVPKDEQLEIFEPSPAGCRKVILSTNIAETSVTVTDVRFVVDTGKLRENRYDQLRRITKLQCVWESKSNARQRMGRAGRVQDGFYYALFSKERSDSMRAIGLPELLRSDLQETCLSISAQKFDEPVASFLAQAIEAPRKAAIDVAVKNLKAIEAYTADEELTALGRVLSKLPVHPTLGKMIILGVIFRCLDPMIMLGAASEERSLFLLPTGRREEARKIHKTYADEAESDHLAQYEAFKELRQLRHNEGVRAVSSFATTKFLHYGAFRNIDQTSQQIVRILVDSGLIPPSGGAHEGIQYGPAALNTNANNADLIKCLLLAGSHPNLAVKTSTKGVTYRTPTEATTVIHPTSRNRELGSKTDRASHAHSSLFTYSTLSRSNDGNQLYMRDTSKVSPLMAVLFGGQLSISSPGKLEMDDWLPVRVKGGGVDNAFTAKLVLEFRKALERVLHRAYAGLADVGARERAEEGNESGVVEGRKVGFVDDPVREGFAKRVVEVLGGGVEKEGPKW